MLSIVGARPQFIKLAPVHRALKARHIPQFVVHTGQHYDDAMSAQFFRELKLPRPDVNLGIPGGSHAGPTARMLGRIAKVIDDTAPAMVVVYGDTTSTLAGALAGAQCGVPVAHVEAGLRSFLKHQPEERNRVVADHLADLLFCPTTYAVDNLRAEGIREGVHRVGDPMHDALRDWWPRARRRRLKLKPGSYLFCTLHRAENTDDPERLAKFVDLLAASPRPVLVPLHPRTRRALRRAGYLSRLRRSGHVQLTEPLSYLDTLNHIGSAAAVLTDSGGVQREAAWLGTLCLTLRTVTEWIDTVREGRNVLVDLDPRRVRMAMDQPPRRARTRASRVRASSRIAEIVARHL